MGASLIGLPGKGTFARGVHPPERKDFASDVPIEAVPPPAQIQVALLQHTGAPCEAAVKNRQKLSVGDVVGTTEAFISAPVHTSVAGVAGRAAKTTLPNGRRVPAIPVKVDGEQLVGEALWDDVFGGEWPRDGLGDLDPGEMVKSVRDAGIVGQGGAAFPTHVKLTPNDQKPTDTLLLNGCECEPYLTADYRLMLEAPGAIVTGAILAGRCVRAENVVIAVEDNKPAAVEVLREAAEGTSVQVAVVKTLYPMGGERQLIPAVMAREVPTGGLPLDVGVVVLNVGTSAAIARAVLRGKPLTHRVVAVSGAGVAEPKNLLVPVGMSYGEAIEFCGGLAPEAGRVIAGGPMMGFALGGLDAPITKGTSGITVLTHEDLRRAEETACVRCGRCVDSCPLNLVPTKLAEAAKHSDWDLAGRHHMMACVECGCCAFTCPAQLPLVQLIRMGKAQMPR